MGIHYSSERNVQILIAVLKANHISKVIVSPGATNISFVASIQNDPAFTLYSAVDERGAAYIACGLAAESGEPVVITCTGATASRNYLPGLTEAYHKKLPVLAVTASQDFANCGHLSPQYIDRTEHPADAVKLSVQIPIINSASEEWDCEIKINKAVLELFRNGGGPVHINLASSYSNDFRVSEPKKVRTIRRFFTGDALPELACYSRIGISVGAHKQWSPELTETVDAFCEQYGAVVFVDHSSGYWGKYRVLPTVLTAQIQHKTDLFAADLLIHIGEEHGNYYNMGALTACKEVWRVSPDGELRDTYKKLSSVFQMEEIDFFRSYASDGGKPKHTNNYYQTLTREITETYALLPELPFSNIWVARQVTSMFPQNASIHLGVSNTMRSWTFFDFPKDTYTLANTGCRGIDGAIATTIGMALAAPEKIHFAVMGDLTFFYGLNALGNRHLGKNVRIVLINNGCGSEFNLYQHRAYQIFEGDKDEINRYVAAGGHFSSKSPDLVKHFAEDLGFAYYRATDKKSFFENADALLSPEIGDKPILFEVVTSTDQENAALKAIRSLRVDTSSAIKQRVAGLIGPKMVSTINNVLNRD